MRIYILKCNYEIHFSKYSKYHKTIKAFPLNPNSLSDYKNQRCKIYYVQV